MGAGRASLPIGIAIGSVIAGKYRVERVLGSGGMGVVVAASHVGLGQTVAIKFLLPREIGQPALARRLVREARAAAALKGNHVARVYDVDVLPDGTPYLVLEYLEGRTLSSLIAAQGPLSAQTTVDFALQACEALAEAHALGIVHRDLKPANLFLARGPAGRETLRVLDFGISKSVDRGQTEPNYTETDSHALVGSPPYVSPEQLMNPRAVDHRTDIWSLGITLYECLSGHPPFRGATLAALWDAILREPAPRLPAVPTGLERAVLRCLEKQPSARFANVQELARELSPFGSQRTRASMEAVEALSMVRVAEPAFSPPSADPNATVVEDAAKTEEPTMSSPESKLGSRLPPLVPVLALLALGLGGWYAFGSAGGAAAPAASSANARVASAVPAERSVASAGPAAATSKPDPPSEVVQGASRLASAEKRAPARAVKAPKPRASKLLARSAASAEVAPPPAATRPSNEEEDVYSHRK